MIELEGFGDGYASEAELNTRALVQEQNRKKKKSGGFQSMGLSYNVFRGIIKNGYKVPTPIQRKVIISNSFFSAHFINISFLSVYPSYYGREGCRRYGEDWQWQNSLFLDSLV